MTASCLDDQGEVLPPMSQSQKPSDMNPTALRTSDSEQSRSNDPEKQAENHTEQAPDKVSAFKSLGLLDRFLAIWIFLAMLIGILLGNFVSNTGPALQKGKFVGVSIPIGAFEREPVPSPFPPRGRRLMGPGKPSVCSS